MVTTGQIKQVGRGWRSLPVQYRSNRRANEAEQQAAEAERQQSVTPEEEFFRRLQDALNGLPYDNFWASLDYDKGLQEVVRCLQE